MGYTWSHHNTLWVESSIECKELQVQFAGMAHKLQERIFSQHMSFIRKINGLWRKVKETNSKCMSGNQSYKGWDNDTI